MEIKGEINFFVSVRKGARFYEGSINRKNSDGTYTRARIDLEFGKKNFPVEKLNVLKENVCYTFDVDSGFLSVACYKDKDGKEIKKVIIHIEQGNLVKQKECAVTKKNDDLPF